METIPLFPLSTVLLPKGRMVLQIFEPRYLDLVSRSLKHDTGFGVLWLRQGSEVYRVEQHDQRLAPVGCYAKIVDWDSLANGLLGITIEGVQKFRLLASYQQEDHLQMADIEWIDHDPVIPLTEQSQDMSELLAQILQHPHVERMKLDPDVNDVATLGFLLAQLLPIEESLKLELLTMTDPINRLALLTSKLDEISQ